MLNGNYKLIDLKNIEIKSGATGATIDGVYDAIDKATMPVKVINVNKAGTKLVSNFGQGVRKSDSDYYVDLGDGTELKVTSSDKVTYADKSGGGSAETGYVEITFTDGVGVIGETHKKDINVLKVTIKESDATVVNNYYTPFVQLGSKVLIPVYSTVETVSTLTALYEVHYIGVSATVTKITLS